MTAKKERVLSAALSLVLCRHDNAASPDTGSHDANEALWDEEFDLAVRAYAAELLGGSNG